MGIGSSKVAKVSIGEFARQVRAEAGKVVWPSWKETVTTAVMVLIMTMLLGTFFFGVDAGFNALVRALLGLVG
jgi:preprotein translocase subunit SecE